VAGDPQHALVDVVGQLLPLVDQLPFRVVQIDEFFEIVVAVGNQGVQIPLLGLQCVANRGFEFTLCRGIPSGSGRLQYGADLSFHVGQLRATVLQFQRRQLPLADGQLPRIDAAAVVAHVGQLFVLLAQQQAHRIGEPHGIHLFAGPLELVLQPGKLLFDGRLLTGGFGDLLGQLFSLFGPGGVLLGEAADGRMGQARFETRLHHRLLGLLLALLVGELLPPLDLLLGERHLADGQIATQR
jgi:hypothetical protein